MKKPQISSLGIDISKKYLDVYCCPFNFSARYENTLQGFEALLLWIQKHPVQFIVFEPSGGYEKSLRVFLATHNINFSMVNAAQVCHFAKGLLAKTDKIDAVVLAEYGLKLQPKNFIDVSPEAQALQEWIMARRKITEALYLEYQRLEHNPASEIEILIHQTINHFKTQQSFVDEKIRILIKNSPTFSSKKHLLMQEKGIGEVTSATLIAELPELGTCSHQQIAALVGVAPHNHDSGNLKGYRCTKGGRQSVRCALYMAVISAIKSNPKIQTFYRRLRENGKKAKVAITACIRKFVIILNAILRNAYSNNLIPT